MIKNKYSAIIAFFILISFLIIQGSLSLSVISEVKNERSFSSTVAITPRGNGGINRTITTKNIPPPYDYGVDMDDLQVYFKNSLTSAKAIQFQIKNSQGTRDISYQLQSADPNSIPVINDNSITYPNAFTSANVTYTVHPQELRKIITLQDSNASFNYTFKLQFTGATYSENGDGSINFYDENTGERLWTVARPYGYDSRIDENGEQNPEFLKAYYIIRQAGINYFLDLIVNETDKTKWTYPVYIDPTTQSGCGTLSTANTIYQLNQSITGSGTCITIGDTNITLDCAGNTITFDTAGSTSSYGVTSGNNDYKIMNCIIVNGTPQSSNVYGIEITSSKGGTIFNNTVHTYTGAIRLGNGNQANYHNISHNNLTTKKGSGNTGDALVLGLNAFGNANHNNIEFNYILGEGSTADAVFLNTGDNNTFVGNVLRSTGSGVNINILNGSGDFINTSFETANYLNSISWSNGARGPGVTIQWYVNVTVRNYTGSYLANANVSFLNQTLRNIIANVLTDTNGALPIQTLIDVIINRTGGGGIPSSLLWYQSPYTVNTTLAGYVDNETSLTLNVTNSTNLIVYLFKDIYPPSFSFVDKTPANGSSQSSTTVTLNVSIKDDNSLVSECILSWNDVNETMTMNETKGTKNLVMCSSVKSSLSAGTYNYSIFSNDTLGNNNNTLKRFVTIDTTMPSRVTSLNNQSAGYNWIYINWTNPSDSDFSSVNISINGAFTASTTTNSYNATSLLPSTNYTFDLHTVDTAGNINNTNTTVSATTLSGCGTLNLNTTLTYNLLVSTNCFNINSSNMFLDCGGNSITYATGTNNAYGVLIDSKENVTIKNCKITENNFRTRSHAIYINKSKNIHITNNTLSILSSTSSAEDGINIDLSNNVNITSNIILNTASSGHGLNLSGSNNSIVSFNNITATGFGSYGIVLVGNSKGNILTNNNVSVFYNSGEVYGIYLDDNYTRDNILWNNTLYSIRNYSIFDNTGSVSNNSLIYSNNYGFINWTIANLTVRTNLSLNEPINLSQNFVALRDNTIYNLNLNSTAIIEIRNLSATVTPRLLRNGARCDNNALLCNIMSYSGGILTARIYSFSNYTTQANNAPTTPALISPTNNSFINTNSVIFSWSNSTDADNDQINYSIRISNNTAFNVINYSNFSVVSGVQNNTNISFNIYDGIYYWHTWAGDDTQNSSISENRTFTIDTTSPTIVFNTPSINNGSFLNINSTTFNLTFSDTNIANISFALSNTTSLVNTTIYQLANNVTNNSIRYSNLVDGLYFSNASVFDKANNANTVALRSFTIDTILSVINFNNPTANNTFTTLNTFVLNVSITEINPSNITFTLYNSTGLVNNTMYYLTDTINNLTINYTNLLNNIVYTFNVSVYDSAGNLNNTVTRTITLDNVNPTIVFNTPSINNGSYLSTNTTTFNLTFSDNNIANITFSLSNKTSLVNTTIYYLANNNTNTSITYPNLLDELYFFNATITDKATNVNTVALRSFTIDTVKPTMIFINPVLINNSYSNLNNLTINISLYDLNLGNITFIVENKSLFNNTLLYLTTNLSNTSLSYLNIRDDPYSFNVSIYDLAGNFNTTELRKYTIDTTLPIIFFESPSGGNTTNYTNSFTINVNITEINIYNVTFTLSNTTNMQENSTIYYMSNNITNTSITYRLTDNSYTINVSVGDLARNINYTTLRTYNIDGTAPNITIREAGETGYNNGTTTIGGNTTDVNITLHINDTSNGRRGQVGGGYIVFELHNNSGLLNRTIRENTIFSFEGIFITGINFSTALSTTIGLDDGDYTINITTNDSLNNRITSNNRTFTIDKTPPTINIASNTQSTNISNARGQTRIFINITSNDTKQEKTQTGGGFYLFQLYNETTGIINSTIVKRTTFAKNLIEDKTTNMSISGLGDLEDGIYFINVTVNDSLGNYATTGERRIYVDRTAPNITIREAGQTGLNNGTVTQFGNATDINITLHINDTSRATGQVGGGYIVFELHNNSGLLNRTIRANTIFKSDTTFTTGINFSTALSTGLDDGEYIINITTNDSLNNRIISVNRNFTIDKTPPNISIETQTPYIGKYIRSRSIYINISTNDSKEGKTQAGGGYIIFELHNSSGLVNRSIIPRETFNEDIREYTFINISNRREDDLVDGNYTFNITANDSLGNRISIPYHNIIIDREFPISPEITSSLGNNIFVFKSTEITCKSSDLNLVSDSLTMSIQGKEGNQCSGSNKCSFEYMSTSTGGRVVTCSIIDLAGNVASSTQTIVIYPTGSGGGGGGGGGGGAAAVSPSTIKATQLNAENVKVGIPLEFTIKNPELSVDKITITTKEDVPNIRIAIKNVKEKPVEIPVINGEPKVFKYFEVIDKNVDDKIIENARINFKIEKDWLEDNKAQKENVVLYRYNDNTWKTYKAVIKQETKDMIYYESVTPGFSMFAIGLLGDVKIEDEIKLPDTATQKGIVAEIEILGEPLLNLKYKITIAGLTLIIIIIFTTLLIVRRRIKRKKNK